MRSHLRYLSYVVRHKWFVLVAGLRVGGIPLWRLLVHDWSKFTPAEWAAYVRKFYGFPAVGDVVWGVADGGPLDGEVVALRPSSEPGKVDCRIRRQSGKEYWAWHFEVQGCLKVDAEFDRAWLHHQHANPHHWEHWVLREDNGATKLLPMPEHFAREMVADWMGAGRAITGQWEVREWYAKNRPKIILHPATEMKVDALLGSGGL